MVRVAYFSLKLVQLDNDIVNFFCRYWGLLNGIVIWQLGPVPPLELCPLEDARPALAANVSSGSPLVSSTGLGSESATDRVRFSGDMVAISNVPLFVYRVVLNCHYTPEDFGWPPLLIPGDLPGYLGASWLGIHGAWATSVIIPNTAMIATR